MNFLREFAVAGGGPSGAMCAAGLARAGFDVTLFDEHLAWEKPCGGGLTYKALLAYPFLRDNDSPKRFVDRVELVSSAGYRVRFKLDHPVAIYSRAVLNGLLLERARQAGCRIVRARVTHVDTCRSRVRFQADGQVQEADFIVIAAGARNAILPDISPLSTGDLEITVGYFIPSRSEILKVRFFRGLEGYVWSFPRADHLSAGICGRISSHTSTQLRDLLDRFLRDEMIDIAGARLYSHVLPAPPKRTLCGRPTVGRNWALTGDAAALVDPITGEGIYYALRSGDLLAQSLAAGHPEQYPRRLRADFLDDLTVAAKLAPRFYRGRFLGGEIPTRMVQFASHSPRFQTLVRDIFSGTQHYRGLRQRLWMQLGVHLSEVASALLRPSDEPSQK